MNISGNHIERKWQQKRMENIFTQFCIVSTQFGFYQSSIHIHIFRMDKNKLLLSLQIIAQNLCTSEHISVWVDESSSAADMHHTIEWK